jgi:lysosomal alpha-mannosidase
MSGGGALPGSSGSGRTRAFSVPPWPRTPALSKRRVPPPLDPSAAGHPQLNDSSQASGAYIFRPASETPLPLQRGAATITSVTGPVVNEVLHTYAYVTQETRLWAGAAAAEIEWTVRRRAIRPPRIMARVLLPAHPAARSRASRHRARAPLARPRRAPQVGPVDVSDGQSHEVVTRYSADMATDGGWTTDSNCAESQPRRRNYRSQWPLKPSEAVTANYFPTNCLIKTASADVTLAVAVDRSQGSTSLANGQLELMVHRRMLFDDGERGGRWVRS